MWVKVQELNESGDQLLGVIKISNFWSVCQLQLHLDLHFELARVLLLVQSLAHL